MKKLYRLIAIITVILLMAVVNPGAFAADGGKLRLAILNFRASSVSRPMTDSIRDMVEVELYRTGLFEMLERNQFDIILREQGFGERPCDETNCAVQIGKAVSADKIIIGSVNRIDGIGIAVKLIDVKKGTIEYADIDSASSEKILVDAIKRLTGRIALKIETDPGNESYYPRNKNNYTENLRYYSLGLVPGLGQIYAGYSTKGYLFLGCFIAAAGFMGYSIENFYSKRDEYESFSSGTKEELDQKYNQSEKALRRAKISIGIFSAVYIANFIDVIFFNAPLMTDISRSGQRNFAAYSRPGINLDAVHSPCVETRVNIYYSGSF